MKRIIEATERNNRIARRHMISLVTTDSFVALSIRMIGETNHNSNVETEPYRHLAPPISSKRMSHTGHMGQMTHCLPITTPKMSLHTMPTSLNLHATLMSSSTTLRSLLDMVIHPIHVVHVECL